MQSDSSEWLTVQDVSTILKVHEESVRRWIRGGTLPVLNLGSTKAGYRVHRSDLETFVRQRYGPIENEQGQRESIRDNPEV